MAQTRAHAPDLFGRVPKITFSGLVRWNQRQLRLERHGWQAGANVWQPFTPPLLPVRVGRDERRDKLNISAIANTARQASAVSEARRTVSHRMAIAAWNQTWRCLKCNHPALADMISYDFVAQAKAIFNASIEIDMEVFTCKK